MRLENVLPYLKKISQPLKQHKANGVYVLDEAQLEYWVGAAPYEDRAHVADLIRRAELTRQPVLKIENTNISSLPNAWPNSLRQLEISHCDQLSQLQSWPKNLQQLDIKYCRKLNVITSWPTQLKQLSLQYCPALTTLTSPWPESLCTLTLFYCQALHTIGPWPSAIRALKLYCCPNLITLECPWPQSLWQLDIHYCPQLNTFNNAWPKRLHKLSLAYCQALGSLTSWPQQLHTLKLSSCPSLSNLPQPWPNTLKIIDIDDCLRLSAFSSWPAGLQQLSLRHCPSLARLPKAWPESLTQLDIQDCRALTSIERPWPRALQNPTVVGCPMLAPLVILMDWYEQAGASGASFVQLQQQWKNILQITALSEVDLEILASGLKRLDDPALSHLIQPRQLMAIFEEILSTPQYAKWLVEYFHYETQYASTQTCKDHLLLTFSTLQSFAHASRLQRQDAETQDILKPIIAMIAQRHIDHALIELNEIDHSAVDNQRALRYQLAKMLDLPCILPPLFSASTLNSHEWVFAKRYLNEQMKNVDTLIGALLAQPIWIKHLESLCPHLPISQHDPSTIRHYKTQEVLQRAWPAEAQAYVMNQEKFVVGA